MTLLTTMMGRLDRTEGLRLRRIPEIGDALEFIDRTARPDGDGTTQARTRIGIVSEVHPGGVTLTYEINGHALHAFMCWADVAHYQQKEEAEP